MHPLIDNVTIRGSSTRLYPSSWRDASYQTTSLSGKVAYSPWGWQHSPYAHSTQSTRGEGILRLELSVCMTPFKKSTSTTCKNSQGMDSILNRTVCETGRECSDVTVLCLFKSLNACTYHGGTRPIYPSRTASQERLREFRCWHEPYLRRVFPKHV